MLQYSSFITAKQTGNLRSRSQNVLLSEPRRQLAYFDQDGPGDLSSHGPRHDNDHAYIHEIRILPTADECLQTIRAPWIPQKNVNSPHYIVHGPSRHFDTHFRLLRQDAVEKIRDVNYHAAQISFGGLHVPTPLDGRFVETPVGNRYFFYPDCKIEDVVAHKKHGIVARMSSICPENLRGPMMRQSSRLEKGMLAVVLCLDHENNKLSTHYFEIVQRESTFSLRTRYGHDRRAAVQLAMLPDASSNDIAELMGLVIAAPSGSVMSLIEYPSVLCPGFANPLRCLQRMSDGDYAFAKYVSPNSEEQLGSAFELQIAPPMCSLQNDHKFDFSPLTSSIESTLTLKDLSGPQIENAVQHLAGHTTLDIGQLVALLSSLIRELAFTQGPPGTGKTFLSITLTRVLLASRSGSKIPILLVCRTNHALDAFLAGLRDACVENPLRAGRSSREDWTKDINLREVAYKQRSTRHEKAARLRIESENHDNWMDVETWCKGLTHEALTGFPCWQHISLIVAKENPQMRKQLVTNVKDPKVQAFVFDHWASGGDLSTIQGLQEELTRCLGIDLTKGNAEVLAKQEQDVQTMLQHASQYTTYHATKSASSDFWRLSLRERQQLLRLWQSKIDKAATARHLCNIQEKHVKLARAARSVNDDKDIQIMRQQNIVAMTTTACAGRWDMLRKVEFEIMICEEAGEVLEAHALCSLLPTLQHAINIGDPLQLRPDVDQQSLAMETTQGQKYRLNESLFERIMQPIDPLGKAIPTSRLSIQRRMHPEIADISRITYPYLQDHSNTSKHPVPKGLRQRMWWFDHVVPEDIVTGVSKSITNEHEAQAVKTLVAYLLYGSDYSPGDIAVLTPYAGQVVRLRDLLSEVCNVWIGDQDKEEFLQNGAIDPEDDVLDGLSRLAMPLKTLIRLATIDNFQGEEAKVIILSTVRSGQKLGFVKCPNRINVACSRAIDGFYVFGNSAALRSNPVWNLTIRVFDKKEAVQPYIGLLCNRHPEHSRNATSAEEIETFPACQIPCGQNLDCDHICSEMCHDPDLHQIIPCTRPCQRGLPCGHICKRLCHEKCGPCQESSHYAEASCGHLVLMSCSGEAESCSHFKSYLDLSCGRHAIAQTCGGKSTDSFCDTVCGLELACGHQCEGVCGACYVGAHPNCLIACGKPLSCCHGCAALCHSGACPPCEEICQPHCNHLLLTRRCRDVPKPCLEPVVHDDLTTVCAFADIAHNEIDSALQQVFFALADRCRDLLLTLDKETKYLLSSHTLFLIMLDTRALAAGKNVEEILRRHDAFATTQSSIAEVRSQLTWIEAGMNTLNKSTRRSLNVDMFIETKLGEIELRAICSRSEDTMKTISHLLKMKDASMQMQRLGHELGTFVKRELRTALDAYGQVANWILEEPVAECQKLLENLNDIMMGERLQPHLT